MWVYVIVAAMWGGIISGWLIPVVRKRIICEIYEACGLGGFFYDNDSWPGWSMDAV